MQMALSDARQCSAKTKRTGSRCKNPAVNGVATCRMHGGKSARGVASGTFKTGRYSKALPARLMERYDLSREDSGLTDLSDELALTDARLFELLGRVDSGESGRLWDMLGKAKREYERESDQPKKAAILHGILALIEEGLEDRANWAEIAALMEQRRKLVDTERRRLADASQMVTASEALSLVRAVVAIVQEHVTDPLTIAAIHGGLAGVLDRPGTASGARA